MQPIYDLQLASPSEEPRVWISRFAIYPSWSVDATPIRDFPLTRGVNFIWASEPQRDNLGEAVGGHSAGKTSLCRLLRYALGETSFSTKATTALISEAFPDGYLAAEIHVLGRKWAVRRPLGTGRLSYVLADGSLEDLLREGGTRVSREDYLSTLEFERVLDRLPTRTVPRESRPLGWGHVLAWCSRDQEERFQSIHDWRSPRSESETPAFNFDKFGPLFAMRAVLGILPANELGIEAEIARLESEIETAKANVAEARLEPAYWAGHYRQKLEDWIERKERVEWVDSGAAGGLFSDPFLRADAVASDVRQEINDLSAAHEGVQADLVQIAVDLRENASDHKRANLFFKLGNITVDALHAPENRELLEQWERLKTETCGYGGVLYGDCQHIQNQRRVVRPSDLVDARFRERSQADFQAEADEHEREVARLTSLRQNLDSKRAELLQRRATLDQEIRNRQRALDDLAAIRDGFDEWAYNSANRLQEKIVRLQSQMSDLDRDRRSAEGRLILATTTVHESLAELQRIYSAATRSVLAAPGSNGHVVAHGRDLVFTITRGLAHGGEALGTLSVLLADLAAVVHGCVVHGSSHPCFLLHDSPREADLSLFLYESFLMAAVAFEEALGGPSACPFQYIVTTTTPPPPSVLRNDRLKLQLNAADPSELLLRRLLGEPSELLRGT